MPQIVGDLPSYPLPGADATMVVYVERARGGDSAAFTTLFEHYNLRIFRFLERAVGSPEVARDLTQDTFIAAWSSLPELHDERRFAPWLYRIATNKARMHLRRARLIRWLPWGEADHAREVPSLALVDPQEQVGQSERVRLALAELSANYRTCLLLQADAGFSQREIALMLGMNEKTVSSILSRARHRFREAYLRLEHDAPVLKKARRGGER
ncbi:MAG TPA: sigma-70 family RNA polymerase sigma factor [Ktedonobacterales bacterium]|jgi:RNA polymerase sigma-70 factor (ECF subfamily)